MGESRRRRAVRELPVRRGPRTVPARLVGGPAGGQVVEAPTYGGYLALYLGVGGASYLRAGPALAGPSATYVWSELKDSEV